MKYICAIILSVFLLSSKLVAQNSSSQNDTTIIDYNKLHSPKKATWMSVAVPGLGQIYNKKYWKVPIIYGLFGTFGYLSGQYNKNYLEYRQHYKDRLEGLTQQKEEGEYWEVLTTDQLKQEMKRWERNRNFNYIGIFLTYIANIIDASVDAYFFYYDISDDLSMKIEPSVKAYSFNNLQYNNANNFGTIGLSVKFSIK